MEKLKSKLLFFLFILAVTTLSQFMVGCSQDSPQPAIIEETAGGLELLDREFGECDESQTAIDPKNQDFRYVQDLQGPINSSARAQIDLQSRPPYESSSLEQMFPLRGSWRKSKAEIMDLVNRVVWSPEYSAPVSMLNFFDMVLLINVAYRDHSDPEDSSAQTMQVFLRNGSSNNLNQWTRAAVWSISSGTPCGQKITTPTGVFKLDKERLHPEYYSNQYDDADMYETMFLYHIYQNTKATGVAIHGTYKTSHLGRQDSGGCVRIHRKNSQCLFNTITGNISSACIPGSKTDYRGQVPSLLPKGGEIDPEYLSNGGLMVSGHKVMVAIFNQRDDLL